MNMNRNVKKTVFIGNILFMIDILLYDSYLDTLLRCHIILQIFFFQKRVNESHDERYLYKEYDFWFFEAKDGIDRFELCFWRL